MARQSKVNIKRIDMRAVGLATLADFEKVYTVTDVHDGPLTGVADFNGHPHYFERPFDEDDYEYSSVYVLVPIDNETFQLAMEAWETWKRWEAAFRSGKVGLDTHPAQSGDKNPHLEVSAALKRNLNSPSKTKVKAKAEFRQMDPAEKGLSRGTLQVLWSPLSPDLQG